MKESGKMNQAEIVPSRATIPTLFSLFPSLPAYRCATMTVFPADTASIMDEQPTPPPLPLPLLIIGLIAMIGCAIWTGCLFYFYAGGIVYGVVSGICIGAAYAFATQIKPRLFP